MQIHCTSRLIVLAALVRALVSTSITSAPELGTCPSSDWHMYGDYCYLFKTELVQDYETAQQTCASKGGPTSMLVSIRDAKENRFVWSTPAATNKFETSWIGLNRLTLAGCYEWSDGTPLNYTNWLAGQPDDNVEERCVEILHIDGVEGYWNNVRCNHTAGVICKVRANTMGPCPTNEWYIHGDHCYLMRAHVFVSWEIAKAECALEGGADSTLASIHNASENEFIWRTPGEHNMHYATWIGLYKDGSGQSHKWLDGTQVDYLKWDNNEPNDDANQHCVELHHGEQGAWADTQCTNLIGYTCKAPLWASSTITSITAITTTLITPNTSTTATTPTTTPTTHTTTPTTHTTTPTTHTTTPTTHTTHTTIPTTPTTQTTTRTTSTTFTTTPTTPTSTTTSATTPSTPTTTTSTATSITTAPTIITSLESMTTTTPLANATVAWPSEKGHMSSGLVAGIVIGILSVIGVLLLLIVVLRRYNIGVRYNPLTYVRPRSRDSPFAPFKEFDEESEGGASVDEQLTRQDSDRSSSSSKSLAIVSTAAAAQSPATNNNKGVFGFDNDLDDMTDSKI